MVQPGTQRCVTVLSGKGTTPRHATTRFKTTTGGLPEVRLGPSGPIERKPPISGTRFEINFKLI